MDSYRAYAQLHVKAFSDEHRTFTGLATSPAPDRVGDIVEPLGITFTNPAPLLLYHDTRRPVGTVTFSAPTKAGVEFTARIARLDEPGTVRERLEEAWQSVKAGLLRGVSIGYRPLVPPEFLKSSGGFRFPKTEVFELSLVAVPAHQDATIHVIKSLDQEAAAPGATDSVRKPSSGASDLPRVYLTRSGRPPMAKTLADQITGFEATLEAQRARLNEIQTKAVDEGRTKDESERQDFDTVEKEIAATEREIADLRRLEAVNAKTAKPVPETKALPAEAADARDVTRVIRVKDQVPPGIRFARYAMCLASANGNRGEALEIAKVRYPDHPEIHAVLKAAVAAGSTLDTTWAGALVQYQDFAGDFVEYLRPRTIVGRIPGLRMVPFKIRVAVQSVAASAGWVGEGKPKPVTKSGFTTTTLDHHKVATISVLTEEEVRFSSPSAEAKVRDDLVAAVIARIDQDFIDPTNAGTANVKPASITNGIAAIPASGTDADALIADLANALNAFATNNLTPGAIITSASIAVQLSLMRNAFGTVEFPNLTTNGGTLLGLPVIVSQYLHTLGSPGTGMIVILDPSEIYLADDGQVAIDISREASLEMLDGSLTQNGLTGTGASLVSLWQNNLVGIRAERTITWKRRRDAAVQYISNAAYVAAPAA